MPHHHKSPVNDSAATLRDVHPSPAIWVVFGQFSGVCKVVNVGQFLTGFHPGYHLDSGSVQLQARFRSTYIAEYGSRRDWEYTSYTAEEMGLLPAEWDTFFIVKLQRAHVAMGCTPAEFREKFIKPFRECVETGSLITFSS